MNRKQKFCLWVGIAVIVLMGVIPPVQRTRSTSIFRGRGRTYKTIEYRFILDTRQGIVVSNLLVQWVVVSIITGGLIYAFKDDKPKDEQKQ